MHLDPAGPLIRKQQSRLKGIDGASSTWEAREILIGEMQKRNCVSL